MRIDLRRAAGGTVLAGAVNGRALLASLVSAASTEPDHPEVVFLDFAEVEVATTSFLRESILAFRDLVRGRRSSLYPVIANANDVVTDELKEMLRARGDAILACTLGKEGKVKSSRLIGDLDPKQRLTLELVRKREETDAGELMRAYGESEGLKNPTAWNNRLASLVNRGLLMEISRGRSKRYRNVLGEV